MKIKDGFIALAVAAALSAPAAFAQVQPPLGTEGVDTPTLPRDEGDVSQLPKRNGEETATMEQEASTDRAPMEEQSASAGASISDDQRSRAGEPLSSSSSSSSMSSQSSLSNSEPPPPSESSSMGMGMSQAQSDVPPPVDSETVRNIQQALSDQGHQLEVDGIWGEKTHQALMDFQREQNLDASGQLDGETFAALELTESTQTASSSPEPSAAQEQQQTASAEEATTPPPPSGGSSSQ